MNLCTRQEIKDYLRETSTVYDDFIDALIDRASSLIKQYCNRTFESTLRTELYSGDGSNVLFLDYFPVTDLVRISEDYDDENETVDSEIEEHQIRLQSDIGKIMRKGYNFQKGDLNIYVEYYAGYSTTTLPDAIRQVCIEVIARKFKQSKDGTFGVTSMSMLNRSVTFTYADITKENKEAMAMYRRHPGRRGFTIWES